MHLLQQHDIIFGEYVAICRVCIIIKEIMMKEHTKYVELLSDYKGREASSVALACDFLLLACILHDNS